MALSTKAGSGVSRRRFLGLCAASMGGLALVGAESDSVLASTGGDSETCPAVLIDVTRCVGCGNCQRACLSANGLEPSAEELDKLSADTYTFIDKRDVAEGQTRTVKRQCMHCLHPACVSACTVGALHRTPEGVVVVDTDKCIGCRYCQYACPFGVPQFEWDNTLSVVRKCTSCIERLAQGEAPACTGACPAGALQFGQRAELVQTAHARLAAAPDTYIPSVYGEMEVGGTNRLYISDVPFDQLGLPVLAGLPAPYYAEQVMTRTPLIALGVAAACTGIYSFLRRREDTSAAPSNEETK